ncbi:MAG: hypothetical protein ITG07_02685 [Candidimonas sp.]|nr:hypothetical protein [Candidimonas sp.]
MDVQKLFESQFEEMRKQDQAKYFLMKVQSVKIADKDPDAFMATGVRIDNDQTVVVFSKKSSSGQHFPEKGGILRADKVSRLAQRSTAEATAYKAEYFHAYRNDDFCIRAIGQAQRPQKNAKNGMWSADMRFFDTEVGPVMLDGNQIVPRIEQELTRMLMPWASEQQSSITHDVKGDSLWGDGNVARPGLAPFVAVRSGNKTFYVYGDGAVRDKNTAADVYVYDLPTDEQIQAKLQKNTGLQNLLSVIKGLEGQATPEQLAELKVTLVPGLQVSVGRESLGGDKRNYLAVPDAFDWKRHDVLDNEGNPTTQPGYRMCDVHIKPSRKGRMMVVDAAPSAGGRLTQFIPETSVERALRVLQNQQQAPEATPAAQQPASAKPQAPVRRQAEVAESQYDVPARNTFDDAPMDDFGDMSGYAEDLAAMSSAEHGFDTDDDLEALMEEAAQRQRSRASRPSM